MQKLLLCGLLALSGVCAYAGGDYIENRIYRDAAYPQKRAQAVRMLQKRGYRVAKIKPDDYRGRPSLDVDAYRNGREYDIKLSYPGLRILRVRRD